MHLKKLCTGCKLLQATICICDYPNCNDWSSNGTVTTDVPVTDGSGVLCYKVRFIFY